MIDTQWWCRVIPPKQHLHSTQVAHVRRLPVAIVKHQQLAGLLMLHGCCPVAHCVNKITALQPAPHFGSETGCICCNVAQLYDTTPSLHRGLLPSSPQIRTHQLAALLFEQLMHPGHKRGLVKGNARAAVVGVVPLQNNSSSWWWRDLDA